MRAPRLPLRPPRVVYFDAGATLLHVHPSVGAIYAEVARERHGVAADAAAIASAFKRHFAPAQAEARAARGLAYGRDDDDALLFWRELIRRSFAELSAELAAWTSSVAFHSFAADLYDEFKRPERWRLEPTALDTLAALRARGVATGVLSNWDVRLEPLLQAMGARRLVDVYAASHRLGAEKPDRAAYERAAALAGVAPAEAWHVGDSRSLDVVPALAAGFGAAFLLEPDVEKRERLEREGGLPAGGRAIERLSDVLDALAQALGEEKSS